ncbi:conserved hypothetical protein [Gammaproteobacteria bacterium]
MAITLNKLTSDILYLLRANKVTQSETLSTKQLEYHIHNNRALWINRKISKNEDIGDDYFQYINCIELEPVDKALCPCTITDGCLVLRTTQKLPDYATEDYLSLMTIDGSPIQIMPPDRAIFNQYRKYVKNTKVAYIKENWLYIINEELLKYITVRGIWVDPTDLQRFISGCNNVACYTKNDGYPIAAEDIPMISGMVLKEFTITLNLPSDQQNDSNQQLQQNIIGGVK